MLTLITGGARSGKSRYALELSRGALRPVFIATAEGFDDEMRERIRRHREERDERWSTLEEPVDLAGALRRLPAGTDLAVVDCLTVWLGNLVHHRGEEGFTEDLEDFPEITALLEVLSAPPCPLVLVTNEVGFGIIPGSAMARVFSGLAGRLNQAVAARADRVILVVSGLPLVLKDGVE